MPRYHFNPATGRTGACKAVAGKCPFLLEGSRHYETAEEARAGVELFFTEPYTSLSGRLAVQRSRIQREIIQRNVDGQEYLELLPLINERDALETRMRELKASPDEETPSLSSTPVKITHGVLNQDMGDHIIGFHNQIEGLQKASAESFDASFSVSEKWVSRLKTEEVHAIALYSSTSDLSKISRELFDKAIKKAPELEPTTVYSGLSEYVGRDVLRQLDSGIINLDYPISTSLNAAQSNGFMREVNGQSVAVEIETTAGASMLAVSHNPHEFEILLPSGSYEVLERRNAVTMLWSKDGAGLTADLFLKLRRLP